jgi:ATP-binding cassette, subfamily B, multidrug efflux pump
MSDNFMQDDNIKAKMSYLDLGRRLWPFLRRHRMRFFVVVLIIFATTILSRVFPWLIGKAIDEGITKNNLALVAKITTVYIALNLIYTVLGFLQTLWFQRLGNRILFNLREELTLHLQKLPLAYFNRNPTGRIITRLTNDVAQLGDLFTDGVVTVFIQFIRIISIVVAMLLISPKLTLIALASTPFFIWWSLAISQKIQGTLRESKKVLSTLNAFVAENLNGIKVVQLYNRVPRMRDKFGGYAANYRDITLESIRNYAFMLPAMALFNAVTISTSLYFSASIGLESGLAVGSLVAFFFHAQDFIHPIREIIEKYQQFQNSLTSAERVFTLMDEVEEPNYGDWSLMPHQNGKIEIRNLNFKYEGSIDWVLKNINLVVPAGTSAALVGRTGSGKTTLVSLLQRLYDINQASIFIDGVSIEDHPRTLLRRVIGVVQQDNYIFKGTFAENISLGDPSINIERIKYAVELVGLNRLLQRSQRTLDSQIEERGANLSVGERQLIAFARILAFEPDILILDEATANIDSETELLIQKATETVTSNRTSIIIAHRLSTIEKCDNIFVLDKGSIVESGKHAQLAAQNGLYTQMLKKGLESDLS